MILVNTEFSDGLVNWPRVRRHNQPQYPVMKYAIYSSGSRGQVNIAPASVKSGNKGGRKGDGPCEILRFCHRMSLNPQLIDSGK